MKKLFKSVSWAFIAQIVSLAVSAFMSFFVSKLMSVESYGYYQLFLFCTTYVGVLQFGVSEGNYLENGGKRFEELDRADLKNQFLSTVILQLIVLGLLFAGVCVFENNPSKSIVLTFGIISAVVNLWNTFFGLILQAVNQTEKYSKAIIVGKFLTLILFIVAVIIKRDSFIEYIVIYLAGWLVSGVIVSIAAGKILMERVRFRFNLLKHKKTVIAGCSLLFSSLISSFILGINRIYIEGALGIEAFGKVSMALSLSNLLMLFAIQVGMVLFPNIVSLSSDQQNRVYKVLNTVTPYLTPLIILVYFPMSFLLTNWLPNYAESVRWMLLIVPYIVYEIKNQIIYYTFLKTRRQEKYMLLVNVISFAVCAVINLILILLTKNIEYLIIVIDLALIAKSLLMEWKISRSIDRKISVLSWIEAPIAVGATVAVYFFPNVFTVLAAVILYAVFFIIQIRLGMWKYLRTSFKREK